ncbi:pathogenesis-related protein R major form-like [Lycium ferocissimum]|uniref:pathogenesis-related protein R major form-like n=1 Tax=Lycium ferocissimum TaxID=112874 RepID=UPI0028163FD6|nr:pathogenesis-related protein R major form-like [Lycium ferocissimum]
MGVVGLGGVGWDWDWWWVVVEGEWEKVSPNKHILKFNPKKKKKKKIEKLSFLKFFPLFVFLYFDQYFSSFTHAATFNIINRCTYTSPAFPREAAVLNSSQSWTLNVNPRIVQACIWGRTKCKFDGNGRGKCETGDCKGLLQCQGYGIPPNTLAEFALNQPNNLDHVDIFLVDGFNIPMEFSPTNGACRNLRCPAPINEQCPSQLRTQGGCNNPCTVFKTNQYCCTNGPGSCGPTDFSRFFKTRCPKAYSYPQDDPTSLFTCPAGTNYRAVFCP